MKLDLSSYATKTDSKNVAHVDISSFASKTNLASLKAILVDLGKLSKVVTNDVVKKTEYDKLVTKVDNIDTTGFVSKTTYDTDKSDI